MHAFIHSSIRQINRHSIVTQPSIFMHPFIHFISESLIHLFVRSFVHSSIHSFAFQYLSNAINITDIVKPLTIDAWLSSPCDEVIIFYFLIVKLFYCIIVVKFWLNYFFWNEQTCQKLLIQMGLCFWVCSPFCTTTRRGTVHEGCFSQVNKRIHAFIIIHAVRLNARLFL